MDGQEDHGVLGEGWPGTPNAGGSNCLIRGQVALSLNQEAGVCVCVCGCRV